MSSGGGYQRTAASWRKIAAELGERMANHASLDCGHPAKDAEGNAPYCPFCNDHATYQRWYQRELRALRLDRVRANNAKETSA